MNAERCTLCNKLTDQGKKMQAAHHKEHPIYGTELNGPLSRVLQSVRNDLSKARGQLADVRCAYPQWAERTEHVEGLLTCGLMALYEAYKEIEAFEIKQSKGE